MDVHIRDIKVFDNIYGLIFAIFGVLLQIFAFFYTSASFLSLISGATGIFAVVLCAERRMSFWTFAWIQLITYLILALQQNLWGEVAENIFYAITMIGGMFIWNKRRNEDKVKTRALSRGGLTTLSICTFLGIVALYSYLLTTNDSQPLLDSITTIPAIVAQILMILAFREQWYFWLIIDIASIYMWAVAGDWCMVSQFVFWSMNCLYGIYKWKNCEIS